MRIISPKALREAGEKYPRHAEELEQLIKNIDKGTFKTPDQLRALYPSLDNFKYLDKHYVIDIGRNELRVIALIFFESEKFYVRHVFTHKEYDAFVAKHRTKGKK
ncbi:TPA: type II toxin-antitoxin system HigB family toxin [Escherichia coli]|uniref:type II toxin-antitoxin system HigB family toxin n=1 Tax=Enterobacteriaceae TaxID=543 RepID=UPI000DA5BB3B|nr:type II toxin-antitoxin system HigB family toxin [Escherichia coli]EDJ2335045.1 addiction module toxin RelE [Salmonella enterica subsp. enterica serovar Mbandaka]MDD8084381.1 type II toxin-antitoxin system HigB family toxin [Escherichia coli]MDD8174199.1 type II toxin-antitoxin system HigB family toxin [Escherichia coli]SQN95529.1 translation-dependent mRNA interferase, toxin of the HigB-HigA toxin-antitoxin system [Escherichia coli]HAV2439697.1 addiction module toxin RelE [Escherichia coli